MCNPIPRDKNDDSMKPNFNGLRCRLLSKFIYFEKSRKICKISIVDLSYVVQVKCMVEISQYFSAFSEYMNFTKPMKTKKIFSLHHNFLEMYLKFFVIIPLFENRKVSLTQSDDAYLCRGCNFLIFV